MRSKQYFSRTKNNPHEKSTEPKCPHKIQWHMKGYSVNSIKLGLSYYSWGFNNLP